MKRIALIGLLALSACAQPAKPDWYTPEVSDADREIAANIIWGPDANCTTEAQKTGVPASRAALICACVKGVMASKISKETVDYLVSRRPEWGDPVPAFIEADANAASEAGLRICK